MSSVPCARSEVVVQGSFPPFCCGPVVVSLICAPVSCLLPAELVFVFLCDVHVVRSRVGAVPPSKGMEDSVEYIFEHVLRHSVTGHLGQLLCADNVGAFDVIRLDALCSHHFPPCHTPAPVGDPVTFVSAFEETVDAVFGAISPVLFAIGLTI